MALATTQAKSIFVDAGNGTTTGVDLSIGYIKALKVLLHKTVSLINASIANPQQVNLGTAIYYIGRRNIVKNYDGTQAPDAVHQTQINVTVNYRKIITFTIESLDLELLGAKYIDNGILVSQSFVNNWIDARAKSVAGYLYASITKGLVDTATGTSTPTVINLPANKSDGTVDSDFDNARANVWAPIKFRLAELEGLVNTDGEYIGLDPDDYVLLASPKLKAYLILSTTNYSNESREALLKAQIAEIAGIRVQANPFLGNNYAAGTFDTDEALDLSGVDGILVHKESYAYPYNNGVATNTVQPNTGNINFLHKFVVPGENTTPSYGVALRPTTIQGFKITNQSASPEKK